MEEIEAATHLPIWVHVALGFLAALGGFEFIKYLLSLRHHRKKDKAEAAEAEAVANQQAAVASQQDADWREKELQLMTSFVNTAKEQYEDLTKRYEELKEERELCHRDKAEMMMEMRKLDTIAKENSRKIEGLQNAFTEEVARRKASERLYCSLESCKKRQPPVGTFNSDEPKKKAMPRKKTTKTIVIAPGI